MRYTLDNNGYIKTVAWGCMTGNCAEYTGAVPSGYSSLVDWADNACINAYYLDENGNLMLDAQKMNYLQAMYEQQAIDYAPVLHRDLYATNEIIEAQYKKNIASGTIITLTNARGIAPMVKITGLTGNSLSVFAQTKNMLRNDAISLVVNGLTFTRDGSGIKISGTATAAVEYTISGGEAEPLFALLAGHNYCLNVGGYNCELLYFDGETTEQVYTGIGGVINLSESKRVSEVKLKFASGQTVNDTIYPTLAYGTATIAYEECQTKVYNMELPDYEEGASIIIGEGLAVLYSGGKTYVVGRSNMGLLNGYNMIYTSQGNNMEITYTTNEFLIDDMAFLQGTATTTGKFMILEDGSIMATDGMFNGEVTCTKLTVAAGASISGIDTGVSPGQVTQITQNAIATGDLIIGGYVYDAIDSDKQIILGVNQYGNLQVGTPYSGATYGNVNIYAPENINFIPGGEPNAAYFIMEVTPNGVNVEGNLTVWGDLVATYADLADYYSEGDSIHANYLYIANLGSNSSATPLYISPTSGIVCDEPSSSLRYKNSIKDVEEEILDPQRLYDLPVRQYKWNEGHFMEDEGYNYDTNHIGFIAEEVAAVYPYASVMKNGVIETWDARKLVPPMLKLIQDQKKEIDSLKASIEEIKNGGAV